MFELSGDDERNNRAEAAEHDTESLIENIFAAADEFEGASGLEWHEANDKLSKAIDAAMSHAYAEGRADERQDWIERTPNDVLEAMADRRKEQILRAMNETGQGEHGVTHERL